MQAASAVLGFAMLEARMVVRPVRVVCAGLPVVCSSNIFRFTRFLIARAYR